MYTDTNYKTKKAMIADFKEGKTIKVHQPGGIWGPPTTTGVVTIEGPHYPQPHSWYCRVDIEDLKIVKIHK